MSRIDQGILSSIIGLILKGSGIDKRIAKEVLKDPLVKKQLHQMQDSLGSFQDTVDSFFEKRK